MIVCGPSTLVSPRWAELGVEYTYSLDEILPRVDVLNLLRIQFERRPRAPFLQSASMPTCTRWTAAGSPGRRATS